MNCILVMISLHPCANRSKMAGRVEVQESGVIGNVIPLVRPNCEGWQTKRMRACVCVLSGCPCGIRRLARGTLLMANIYLSIKEKTLLMLQKSACRRSGGGGT